MDTILVQLLSQYAEGGIITLLILFNVFFYKKTLNMQNENKEKLEALTKEISTHYNKSEVKELLNQELKIVEASLNNITSSISRIDNTMAEIRTFLYDMSRRNKD